MIPLRDRTPLSITPYVTYALIVLNSLVFIWMYLLPETSLIDFVVQFSVVPSELSQGLHMYSMVSYMFLHGGIFHILGNMLFLHIFGPSLEERFGPIRYIFFYFLSGIIAVYGQFMTDTSSSLPILGASGAISGLLGAYILLFPEHKVDMFFPTFWFFGVVAVPSGLILFYWFLSQYIMGIGILDSSQDSIAYMAHLVGFVAGLLLTPLFLLGRKKLNNQKELSTPISINLIRK